MTKKVSKKNLICLFPPKGGKGKQQSDIKKLQQELSELGELNGHIRPDSTSDWQTHYDYLEASSLGLTFGSDEMIEEYALRAIQIAIEMDDKDKIAKSYKELFRLYCFVSRSNAIDVGNKSVEAAMVAYGDSAMEVADELSMLAQCYEFEKDFNKTIELLERYTQIYMKVGEKRDLLEALEFATYSASECGRGDKVEEYAKLGLQVVAEYCGNDGAEFADYVEYFQQMIETAHKPPVPLEQQRSQLVALFPGLEKLFPGACKHLP
ncbi:MAG: hypothetical protein C0507_17325 [Cyanobacteria bacterium PR.3.49]|nr:hypothetical protein [Cyanobacteria bacterium PR.3.49]